ncbi:MAG: hypothetical protein H6634_08075 [Anaerolineales bacterium]|nr:hypothetical protein [Anaerolineales bacterium]MCB9111191.1 hypothetical protein [Anaerolineales bacterium]
MNFRKFRWLAGITFAAVFISSCNIGATPPPALDTGAIQTQAFGQVLTQVADQETQTAAALPPTPFPTNTLAPTNTLPPLPTADVFALNTNTPFTFNTQQPGLTPQVNGLVTTVTAGIYSTVTTKNGCNDGYLVSESLPYDGKTILLGTVFDKSWDFLNTGTCAWDEGYSFAFVEEFSTGPRYGNGKDYIIPKDGPFTKPGETRTFTVTLKTPKTPGEYIWYYKIKDDAGLYFGSLVWVKVISVKG